MFNFLCINILSILVLSYKRSKKEFPFNFSKTYFVKMVNKRKPFTFCEGKVNVI